MHHYGTLEILWLVLIVVLWIGYFVLEGFDFGVGMLLRSVGRDRVERRVLIHTIGPIWDGNEVWLIVAGGATFAAFPDWYATLFSGCYVPFFLIVATLILRPVALEFWGKEDGERWRDSWEWALTIGSALPAFLWGLTFANVVRGVPIDAHKEFTGSVLDLFNPYAILGGLTFVLLCATHGAIFLTLKTRGEVRERAKRTANVLALPAGLLVLGFLAWTLDLSTSLDAVTIAAAGGACAALVLARFLLVTRPFAAFALHASSIALLLVTLFAAIYPNVLVSSTNSAYSLTLGNAASGHYTLAVLTVVAGIFLPAIVVAQGWTYWVFRQRIGREDFEAAPRVIDFPLRPRDPTAVS